jgi:hypothetical protein
MTGSIQTSDSLLGWSDSDTSRNLWAAAAVRETFRPDDLLVSWLERHADSTKEERREAMRAIVELQGVGVDGQDALGEPALRLPPSARRSVLADLGVEGSLSALSQVAEETRTLAERTFADLLSQKSVDADRDDGLKLRALNVAAEWAAAAGASPQRASDDLERRLDRNAFLQLLGGSDLFRFVGRAGVRRLLQRAWEETNGIEWFYIEGPGGIGKSLAVARFIADLLEGDDRPDAVFHLDYDRPQLQVAREVNVLQELVKQSVRWCESGQRDDLRDLSLELASRGGNLEGVHLSSRSSESYGFDRVMDALPMLWRRQSNSRTGARWSRRRIVVFLDSFEQVEYFDTAAALSARRVLERLNGVDVLAICASRGFKHTPRSFEMKPLRLTQFSVHEADTYLKNEASRAGLDVDQPELRQIRSAVGRSPLALRLAVSLLEQSGGRIEHGEWASAARDSPELVQAALYDRLLRRIRDRELRKLAVPGLLLRRLTVEVIEKVLAGPCNLSLGAAGGAPLMESARREGQLFFSDQSDPDAVRHRQDVRATMLDNIERSVGEDVTRAINLAAVAYYEHHNQLTMRVEELYHRLRLDQDAATLDDRWVDDAGRLLRPALQELPKRAGTYLRRRMGAATSSARSVAEALPFETESAESEAQEFRLFATKELQSGAPVDFILDRWRSEGSRLVNPLGDVYASALLSTGQHDRLLSLARDVMVARSTKIPPRARSAVLSIAAGLLEGRDALGEAQSHWIQALAAADQSSDETAQLGGLVGCIRVRRKLKGDSTARSRDMRRGLELVKSMQRSLYQQHVLARESAAEFSEVMLSANDDAKSDLQRLLGYLAEANELLPSAISEPSRLGYLTDLLLGTSGNVPDLRTLSSIAHKMVYDSPDMVERLIQVLRDEVDWALLRVARTRARIAV